MPDIAHMGLLNAKTDTIYLFTLAGLVTLLLILVLAQGLQLRKLNRRLQSLLRGTTENSLEDALVSHMDKIDQTLQRMDALEQAVAVLQAQAPGFLQNMKLIRYNAFEDVGGEQSFSLALLNGQGDGVIITSVYSRADGRVYAKEIQQGRTSHPLSRDEERVLRDGSAR